MYWNKSRLPYSQKVTFHWKSMNHCFQGKIGDFGYFLSQTFDSIGLMRMHHQLIPGVNKHLLVNSFVPGGTKMYQQRLKNSNFSDVDNTFFIWSIPGHKWVNAGNLILKADGRL